MKKFFTTALLSMGCLVAIYAQEKPTSEASVEKNLVNVQFGLTNLSISDEFRLANKWSLRAEYSADLQTPSTYLTLRPLFTLQSRYYYNLDKRLASNKNIKHNAGNFIYGRAGIVPNLVLFTEDRNYQREIRSGVSLVVGYGLRRNLGTHFNFELAGGIGVAYEKWTFKNLHNLADREFRIIPNINLRIGYTF